MKKFLFLILASLLVLGACGQDGDNSNKDENRKSESKSDKKSNDPKENKDKKTNDIKDGSENKSEQSSEQSDEQQNNGQNSQQTQQPNQNQQTSQSNHEPTKEEIYEWDKQNIPGGTDAGLIDPEEANAELRKNEEEAADQEDRIEQINEKMDDPNISDSEYNKLVDEYNELNN